MAIRIPIITTFDKKGVDNALKNINGLSRQAGRAAGALATGVAVGIGASVREFAKFESALNQSLAIMGDVSDTMRGEMASAAREVAKQTTFSAEQAAESFFFLASAGLDAEQSVAALPQVAKFAQAGMFDMATATDLATDAQSALGLASDDAQQNLDNLTRVTDVFVKANTLANTSVEQLATALTTKAGTALKNVGKDVEEGAAALAVFADQGIKGERAGTLLTNTIFGLTDRVKAVPEQFEELGIQVFDSAGEMRNFSEISESFTGALGEMTTQQKVATLANLGFTKQSREGLLALLGQSDALRTYETELRKAGGTAELVADNQLQTFNGQLSLLGSAVQDVAIEIGSQLAPIIADLIPVISELLPKIGDELVRAVEQVDFEGLLQGVENFITFIANNINKLDDLIIGLTAVAVGLKGFTTAIGIARVAAAAFGITLTASLGPIGLIGAALGVLGVGLGAYALQAKEATPEQEKLNQKIIDARTQLNKYEQAQAENTNASKLYQGAIEDQEAELRNLRAAQAEANAFTQQAKDASYAARDASIANRFASQDLIPALQGSAEGYNEMAFAAQNAKLGIENVTIAEEAQRLVQEARDKGLYDALENYELYERMLAEVTAKVRFQTEEQVEFNETVKQTAKELGLVVPEYNSATTSATNYSGATGAASENSSALTGNTYELTESITALNGVMADGVSANQSFLDLMKGIEEIDTAPSVGQATRDIQSLIVELDKADKLLSKEGGLFEFMQGGAKVTAQFDEAGNLIRSFTDPGETPARAVSGETVDINAISKVMNGEFGSALEDLAGSSQGIFDVLLGQTTLTNPETGVSRTISGGEAAIQRALDEGFQIKEAPDLSSADLVKTLTDIGEEMGVDVQLAAGGIVTRPTKALIGEAGPEAVIPLREMGGMGTTNKFAITVNAGMGADGQRIGQQIVEEIVKYEKLSGRVFQRA